MNESTELQTFLLNLLSQAAKNALVQAIQMESGTKEYDKFNLEDIEITDLLGTGAFGLVNLCYFKTRPTELFALKRIDISKIEDISRITDQTTRENMKKTVIEQNIKRVNKEISILKYLKKGNVCRSSLLCYRGSTSVGNMHYILTDYKTEFDPLSKMPALNIQTIEDLVKLPKDQITKFLKIFENIYKAILEIHSIDVVHLDIKPENILYHPDNCNIVIIDFEGACNHCKNTKIPSTEDVVTFECTDFTYSFGYVDIRWYSYRQNETSQFYPSHILDMKNKEIDNGSILNKFKKADIWSLCDMLYVKMFDNTTHVYMHKLDDIMNISIQPNFSISRVFEDTPYNKDHINAYDAHFAKRWYLYEYVLIRKKFPDQTRKKIIDIWNKYFEICDKLNSIAVEKNIKLPNIRDSFAPYSG